MAFPFDPSVPVILVEVTFQGPVSRQRAWAVLDTGASKSLIPWRLAEQLGYDPAASSKRGRMTTPSSTESVPLLRLEALEALGQRAENIEVGVHDLPEQAQVKVLLGLNFLNGFSQLIIDFKRGRLTLNPSGTNVSHLPSPIG